MASITRTLYSNGMSVSKSHRSEWMSYLTYLEYSSTILLLG